MLNSYLSILEDSLKKKLAVLEQIDEVSDVQTALLKEETFDLERFDSTVDEKDAFIKQLSELDDGFETLYEKVREELLKDRRQYEQQIGRMQKLIGQITDKSVSIQAKESRNKAAVERYFAREKKSIGQDRKTAKAAYGYYKNMNNTNVPASRFMDQKK